MNRTIVDSSDIKSVGYHNNILEIEFHSGGIYQYFDVPENIYINLLNAASKGKFFRTFVRERYKYLKI